MRTLAILAFSFAVGTLAAALEPKGGWWLPAAAVLLALVIIVLVAILFAVENYFGKDVEG